MIRNIYYIYTIYKSISSGVGYRSSGVGYTCSVCVQIVGKLIYYVITYNNFFITLKANKTKMTKDEFIRNNRGIDDGQDLHAAYLSSVSLIVQLRH